MSQSVVSVTLPSTPLIDANGRLTFPWIKWFQAVGQNINSGFDPQGNYQGNIGAHATIVGREFLAIIVQHLSDAGVIDAAGMAPATPADQGAVYMPAGAADNHLGSAAIRPATDFDPSGAAATAQANAEALATTAANNAETASKAYTDSKISAAFSVGISGTVVLAKITGGGSDGSLTFTDGLITNKVDPT